MLTDDMNEVFDSLDITCHSIDKIEDIESILTLAYRFKILTHNIRSVKKNFDEFMPSILRTNVSFDLIILTECRLSQSPFIPQLPGYNSYKTTKIVNQNSGVVVYLKDTWAAVVTEPFFAEADCLKIEIPNTLSVLAIYRSPSFNNTDRFITDLSSQLDKVDSGHCVVVAGDININILPVVNECISNQAMDYLCTMAEYGLLPAVTLPTRLKSCIDHIFIKSKTPSVGGVCLTDVTDHFSAVAGLSMSSPPRCVHRRVTLKRDIEGIKLDLATVDWSDVMNATDVNTAVIYFNKQLKAIINKHTKEISISRSNFNLKPWITPGLIRCIKHRDKLHMKSRKNPKDDMLKLVYLRYRNFCKNLLTNLKTKYEEQQLRDCQGNSKKLWKVVKDICQIRNSKSNTTDLLTHASDPQKSVEECNRYFSSIGESLADRILRQSETNEEALAATSEVGSSQLHSLFIDPTDVVEVEFLIKNLQNDKAPGVDELNGYLIKQISSSIVVPLTAIFNMSISSGVFPDSWKIASVCPIHKDGPKDCPENYRPISLLSIFSKLLEKVVNKRLVKYLETQGLISDRQFGFRQGKSTEDAVNLLISSVTSRMDKSSKCLGVFLDLAKAFDTVSTTLLLKKLEAMGIRGIGLNWFKSYLMERRQCLRISQYKSSERPVRFGVPQGSILGPTLFLIYMNDIHKLTLGNAEIICYADDTVLLYHANSWEQVHLAAEAGMVEVASWLQRNLLTLNVKKTKFIFFHISDASAPGPELASIKIHTCSNSASECDCSAIARCDVIRYLGVMIDSKLTFKHHITKLSGQVRKCIYIFRNLRNAASNDVMKMVYYALCHSLLTYCISCWGNAAKTTMIQVERAQRAVLKTMFRKPHRYPTTDLYREASVLSIRKLFILKSTVSTHGTVLRSDKYHHMMNSRNFKIAVPLVKTYFAQRFDPFISAFLYNKISKLCDIKSCTLRDAKKKLSNWLLNLTYSQTEELFLRLQ